MCDIWGILCQGKHRTVSMHNGDFVLPREVVVAVYCPECEQPNKSLMAHQSGWAIRYSMRVLTSTLWAERKLADRTAKLRELWTSVQNWPEPHPCKSFGQFEKSWRWLDIQQLEKLVELDEYIEMTRTTSYLRPALAAFLKDQGWCSFNGDPEENDA